MSSTEQDLTIIVEQGWLCFLVATDCIPYVTMENSLQGQNVLSLNNTLEIL